MMRPASYAEVKALTALALRRRAITNCFLRSDELAREADLGSLRLLEWKGGSLLLKRKGDFDILYYFIFNAQIPMPVPEFDGVCELVFDPGGKSGAEKAEQMLINARFEPTLRRMRLTTETTIKAEKPIGITKLNLTDLILVSDFLEMHFDPRLGCIPTFPALSEELASGCFHAVMENGSIAALIHVRDSEIRHLATRQDCRGRGYAKALVQSILEKRSNKRMKVWCAENNSTALHTYAACGFVPDGYCSLVLQYKAAVPEEKAILLHT